MKFHSAMCDFVSTCAETWKTNLRDEGGIGRSKKTDIILGFPEVIENALLF